MLLSILLLQKYLSKRNEAIHSKKIQAQTKGLTSFICSSPKLDTIQIPISCCWDEQICSIAILKLPLSNKIELPLMTYNKSIYILT